MSRCLLIVNPTAGRERAKYYKQPLKDQLDTMYDEVEMRITNGPGDATDWAREASLTGYDAVFCMGGDGTLNETVNGLAQAGRTSLTFGFVPLGTVNDLGRALHMPLHPEAAIAGLKKPHYQKVDIGRVNDHYFVNTIAAGFMPEAVGAVSIEQKTRLGPLAYFLTGLKALQNHETYLFKIESDNGVYIYRSPLIVLMLTDSVGSFRNIAPAAQVDDGKLWLGIFKDFTYLDLLRAIPEFMAGTPLSSEYMSLTTATHVNITLVEGSLTTNMDGDQGPDFPLDIEVIPSFLNVCVPSQPHHAMNFLPYGKPHLPSPKKIIIKIPHE